MKKILAILMLAVLALSVPFAGAAESNPDYSEYKIALVSDTIGTEQFILQAYNAFMAAAEQYGFTATSIECSDTAAWAEKSRNACVAGYDLLIGIGWVSAEPFSALADEFPDIEFAVVDTVASNPRIKSIAFNTVEGCYVMGAMVASAFPGEKLFGYIGNFQNQSNFEYRYGFINGVKSVTPDAEFMVNFTDSYSDTTVAYNLAMQQAAAGCKFIMGSVASSANQGIYQAALELAGKGTPIYTSGLSVDQTTADNPYIVTGLTKNTGVCTTKIIDDFLAGAFEGGKEILGFADDAFCVVGISFDAKFRNEEIITDSVLDAGRKAAEDIKTGAVVLEVPLEADYKG
ncbi:MAG: BMP family ABC transporter substrate-binding protein [Clostridiales bacterium]|nr:BMP family ABC transporter substrate-binding protein [Clostridiales bacterium]